MIRAFFSTVVYTPLYNGLIFLMNLLPGLDAGVIVIIFTIIIKLLLFPLSQKSVRTQFLMRQLQPELDAIKQKYKNNPQEQAQKTLALYKENNVNPFSGIALLFIQLPIIFALFFVFSRGGLPEIQTDILYSFVQAPATVNMLFLGFLDITERSIILALLTGITQFFQLRLTLPDKAPETDGSFKGDMARSFQLQMKYGMPVFVTIIAYTLPALIGLYWITSNLFAIGQEVVLKGKFRTENNG